MSTFRRSEDVILPQNINAQEMALVLVPQIGKEENSNEQGSISSEVLSFDVQVVFRVENVTYSINRKVILMIPRMN